MVWYFKAFALTGRQVCDRNNPGRCPGLGASALSGRVGQNLRNPEIRKSARRSGDTQVAQSAYPSGSVSLLKWLNQLTQVAQSAYPSGSISLPKWLNQTTQVAQSDYPSGSIRLLKWLNQITQVAQSASPAVCVSEYSRLRKRVQPSA